jgi:hypothetical protein
MEFVFLSLHLSTMGTGGIAPHILRLGTREDESASRSGRFALEKGHAIQVWV